MFLISRDGNPVTLISATDDGRSANANLLRWFHTHHGYSMDHATRHEGYSFREVQGFWDLPFTGDLHTLTCAMHPDLRWVTKGPERRIHYMGLPSDKGYASVPECPCPLTSLYRIEA